MNENELATLIADYKNNPAYIEQLFELAKAQNPNDIIGPKPSPRPSPSPLPSPLPTTRFRQPVKVTTEKEVEEVLPNKPYVSELRSKIADLEAEQKAAQDLVLKEQSGAMSTLSDLPELQMARGKVEGIGEIALPETRKALEAANARLAVLAAGQPRDDDKNLLVEALIGLGAPLVGMGLGSAIGGVGMTGSGLQAGGAAGVKALETIASEEKERRSALAKARQEQLERQSNLEKAYIDAIAKAENIPYELKLLQSKGVNQEIAKQFVAQAAEYYKTLGAKAKDSPYQMQLKNISDKLEKARLYLNAQMAPGKQKGSVKTETPTPEGGIKPRIGPFVPKADLVANNAITKKDSETVQKFADTYRDLNKSMLEYEKLARQNPTPIPFTELKAKQQQLAKDVLFRIKEYYGLGALQPAEIKILESYIPSGDFSIENEAVRRMDTKRFGEMINTLRKMFRDSTRQKADLYGYEYKPEQEQKPPTYTKDQLDKLTPMQKRMHIEKLRKYKESMTQ